MTDSRHKSKPRTIIIVKSCQKFRDRQEACRATWAGELSKHVPLWFLEGGHPETRITDCWLLTSGGDDYNDNSFKLRDSLAFLLEYDPFDRVFICDDDTFVHPARWLAHEPGGDFEGLSTEKIKHVHGGGGWWFSRSACALYVLGIKRRCSWDDQLATEILRKHRVPFVNRPDLYSQWDADRVRPDNTLITCHHVSPREMTELFQRCSADACDTCEPV